MVSPNTVSARELPLFPLQDVVLFPGSPLPLHIFEMRYRAMVTTILGTDRRFGVVMLDPDTAKSARVGCCAEIVDVKHLADGRLNILTRGQERFQVLNFVQEKPYLVGLVEWIEDRQPERDLSSPASEVAQLLKHVVQLSAKLMDKQVKLPKEIPTEPQALSYWVASNLYGVAAEQQHLLEMQDTEARLQREADILTSLRNELAARTALKEALD